VQVDREGENRLVLWMQVAMAQRVAQVNSGSLAWVLDAHSGDSALTSPPGHGYDWGLFSVNKPP
jgi:hypothetical protein